MIFLEAIVHKHDLRESECKRERERYITVVCPAERVQDECMMLACYSGHESSLIGFKMNLVYQTEG